MLYENIKGVPKFEAKEYSKKNSSYCLLIPVINEGERIKAELIKANSEGINNICDIVICDGGSTDGSLEDDFLKLIGVNSLLIKKDIGKQSAQLRMGFWWALNRGYEGFITIDGNNKDSIEDIPKFIEKLKKGYDFIQGSRYVKGGVAINTPKLRHFAVRFIHAPIISLTAKKWYTDTTNAYRAYSKKYIEHKGLQPFREIFVTYELLAYLSVRANQLKLKTCEIPVSRIYPNEGKIPTKISPIKGNWLLFSILFKNFFGLYNPRG